VWALSIAKSNNNSVAVYEDHLLFPSVALSNAIKRIVVLLTSESCKNSIQ
jgi:hypothetical protein